MPNLDDTDVEILSLLAEDARRSFSEIGEEVSLSGAAVSDRIAKLQNLNIIEGFTVEVNHSQLEAGVPVFVQFENSPDETDSLREQLTNVENIEHLFVTVEGRVWVYARTQGKNIRKWIESILPNDVTVDYSVTLMDELKWKPSFDRTEFALTCAECGNTVDSEGKTTRIDDKVYHFCCPSCLNQFKNRYQQLDERT